MTATYWEIGRRIVESEQSGAARANYGDKLIEQLANDLSRQFGRGFGVVNLSQMKRFFLARPAKGIFQTLSEKSSTSPIINDIRGDTSSIQALATDLFHLPWSAYVRLLSVKNPKARAFYETEAFRAAGQSGSWTGKSAANATSASHSQRIRQPCWRRPPRPCPAT
jgi:hypothetical protein